MTVPLLSQFPTEEVISVVELDAFKQRLQTYKNPLQEVRDSL